MLKVITHALKQKAIEGEESIKDNERIDTLLTLAVDGGRYCGPGKFEVIERVYANLVCEGGICSTRKKVLNILQDKRTELVMAMYAEIPEFFSVILPKVLKEKLSDPNLAWCEWINFQWMRSVFYVYNLMVDWQDKHVYNQFLNMYANDLGIRKSSANNDATAVIDPTMKLAFQWIAKMFKEEFMMEKYTDRVVFDTVAEKMGTKSLSKQDLTNWWETWIRRQQDLTETAKDTLMQEFADDSKLFGHLIFDENGSLTEPFLQAMLYDMGVFGDAPVAAANP
jgi:hypothetical protein